MPIPWKQTLSMDMCNQYISEAMHAAMTASGWDRVRIPEEHTINNRVKRIETAAERRLRHEIENADKKISSAIV